MKTIIALSTAFLLLLAAPAYAGSGPTPVSKKDRHHMMNEKKKHKNHKHHRRAKRDRGKNSCNAPE